MHTHTTPSIYQSKTWLPTKQTTAGKHAAQRHRRQLAAPAAAGKPLLNAATDKLPVNVRQTLSTEYLTHMSRARHNQTHHGRHGNQATHVKQRHLFTWHKTCINSMHGPNNKQTAAALGSSQHRSKEAHAMGCRGICHEINHGLSRCLIPYRCVQCKPIALWPGRSKRPVIAHRSGEDAGCTRLPLSATLALTLRGTTKTGTARGTGSSVHNHGSPNPHQQLQPRHLFAQPRARMTHDRWCDVCINKDVQDRPARSEACLRGMPPAAWPPINVGNTCDRPLSQQPCAIPDTHTAPERIPQANCCHTLLTSIGRALHACTHSQRTAYTHRYCHNTATHSSYYCNTPSQCTACFCRSLRPYGMQPAQDWKAAAGCCV